MLSEEESHHAIRVLRLAVGTAVYLVDGHGNRYTATIADAHPKRTVLHIEGVKHGIGGRPYYLHVALAPTKNIDRVEWFLEKATEIGVDEVTPLICDRSERREVKTERLYKVMIAAMKQSLRAYLPKLNEAVKLKEFLTYDNPGQRFIAHCMPGEKVFFHRVASPGGRYTMLVGPEGDFSEAEITAALQAGYAAITLGETRLRTETAALLTCAEAALLNR